MPNHCTNNLMVMGDEQEVKRFREAITNGENLEQYSEFSILANLLPCPEELANTPSGSFASDEQKKVDEKNKSNIAKFGHKDWYEWNCANYGSKWSDFDGQFGTVTPTELNLIFMSAWSPLGEGIRNVSKQFPTLDFVLSYDEGGMAFCGSYAIHNGEFITEFEGEYPTITDEQCENDEYDEFYEQVRTVVQVLEVKCIEALRGVSTS